jgi:hypothetical protein
MRMTFHYSVPPGYYTDTDSLWFDIECGSAFHV